MQCYNHWRTENCSFCNDATSCVGLVTCFELRCCACYFANVFGGMEFVSQVLISLVLLTVCQEGWATALPFLGLCPENRQKISQLFYLWQRNCPAMCIRIKMNIWIETSMLLTCRCRVRLPKSNYKAHPKLSIARHTQKWFLTSHNIYASQK